MSDSRTLQQLVDDVAARADVIITTTSHTTIKQVVTWINQHYARMRGRVIQEYNDDYFSKVTTALAVTPSVDTVALPSDFFKLLGVDFSTDGGGNWDTAYRFNPGERNSYSSSSSAWTRMSPPRYRLFADTLQWRPVPASAYLYRIEYAPAVTRLDDGNLGLGFDFYNGWDRFVCASVAALVLARRGQDPGMQKGEAAEAWMDICNEVRVRDAGEPARILDVMGLSLGSCDYDEEGL